MRGFVLNILFVTSFIAASSLNERLEAKVEEAIAIHSKSEEQLRKFCLFFQTKKVPIGEKEMAMSFFINGGLCRHLGGLKTLLDELERIRASSVADVDQRCQEFFVTIADIQEMIATIQLGFSSLDEQLQGLEPRNIYLMMSKRMMEVFDHSQLDRWIDMGRFMTDFLGEIHQATTTTILPSTRTVMTRRNWADWNSSSEEEGEEDIKTTAKITTAASTTIVTRAVITTTTNPSTTATTTTTVTTTAQARSIVNFWSQRAASLAASASTTEAPSTRTIPIINTTEGGWIEVRHRKQKK